MRQNPVGEPAATAAWNFVTPRRRSSLKRFCPFFHCRQRYIRSLRRIHASRLVSTHRGLAEAEVAAPSDQVWAQPFDDLWQGLTPRPTGHSRIRILNLSRAFGAMRRSLPSFAMLKPRNFRSSGARHRALRLVDLQLELVGQEPADRGHHPLAGAATANIDVAVVGITAEAEASSRQLLVEIVEHEVAQKGRERAALRRALIHRTNQTVLHHPGVEERPDEFEHALVGNPCRDARHQDIVIHSIEEFLEIKIDHDAVAFGDIACAWATA